MKWKLLVFVLVCCSCQKRSERTAQEEDASLQISRVQSTDLSRLTFPLDFPVGDLYQVINQALPDVLVEDTLRLKKKGEYISIKIEPTGRALLASYANNLDVSIPMRVSAEIEKKVLGLKVHKPVSLQIRADMNTKLSIDENWNLNAQCRIQKIHWIEPPVIQILGIKVNLQKKVDKKLAEKSAEIEEKVCEALQKLVPLKPQVQKIWSLISKSHRVGKRPIDIWLTSRPSVFTAHFSKDVLDTLRVMIHTETAIYITPLTGLETEEKPMPQNANYNTVLEDGLDLNVDVYLPYEKMDAVLQSKLGNTTLSYEGATIELTNFTTDSKDDRLHLQFDVVGDLEATVHAYAYPVLGADKSLLIDSIDYDIESDNNLVHLAEWVASDRLSEFLKSNARIPLAHVLDSLDSKIVAALNKSKIGDKVALDMDFTEISSDTLIFSKLGIQWFFDVKGQAHAYLTEELIQ